MIVPSGFASVTVPHVHSGFPRAAAITFGVEIGSSITAPDDVAVAVQTSLAAHYIERIDSAVLVGPTEVQANFGAGTLPGTATTGNQGTLDTASPPPNVAVLVSKRTTTPGREGRGRFFMPWAISKNDVDEVGSLDGTQRTNINNVLDALVLELADNDVAMCVLHNGSGAPSLVTSLVVDSRVATQRKRIGR
jgi:hypothetical protein